MHRCEGQVLCGRMSRFVHLLRIGRAGAEAAERQLVQGYGPRATHDARRCRLGSGRLRHGSPTSMRSATPNSGSSSDVRSANSNWSRICWSRCSAISPLHSAWSCASRRCRTPARCGRSTRLWRRASQVTYTHDETPEDFEFLVAKALDEARDNGLPLHPGAERYWRELAYQIGRSPGPSSGTPDAPKH